MPLEKDKHLCSLPFEAQLCEIVHGLFRQKLQGASIMKIRYFADTDTVYIQLTDNKAIETRDSNENTIIDFDENGNLVAITLEHAPEHANISDSSFQQVAAA